jgi:hypothetical protein
MPFSLDQPAPPAAVPTRIRCPQHGDICRVEAQRILEHADGTHHLYVFAECGRRTSLRPHEFGEHVYAVPES